MNQNVNDICKVLRYLSISPRNVVSFNGDAIKMDEYHNVIWCHRNDEPVCPPQYASISEISRLVEAMRKVGDSKLQHMEIDLLYAGAR